MRLPQTPKMRPVTSLAFEDDEEEDRPVENEEKVDDFSPASSQNSSYTSSQRSGEKRKAAADASSKRARTRYSTVVNSTCARRLCYIMQLLKPLPEDMISACESLLGISLWVDSTSEIDAWTGVYLARIIFSENLLCRGDN